jgi:hypothetical protein
MRVERPILFSAPSELQAATAISKSDADPYVTMFAMAAFVELVEPSTVTPSAGILS